MKTTMKKCRFCKKTHTLMFNVLGPICINCLTPSVWQEYFKQREEKKKPSKKEKKTMAQYYK